MRRTAGTGEPVGVVEPVRMRAVAERELAKGRVTTAPPSPYPLGHPRFRIPPAFDGGAVDPWGLLHGWIDPENDAPEPLVFRLPERRPRVVTGEDGPARLRPTEAALVLDVTTPLSPQVEALLPQAFE